MTGTYLDLLRAAHARLRPSVYVEVGTHEGDSLRLAGGAELAVGIDPSPSVPEGTLPGGAVVLEVTSDEALADGGPLDELLGDRWIDLAFVDGLHLFEVALRDVIGLERRCHAGSTLLLHDTVPPHAEAASRERTTVVWTGDVWKLVPCLREVRPDLSVTTLDTPPAGLTVVRGLDPASTVLADRYDELCERWVGVGVDTLLAGAGRQAAVPGDEAALVGVLGPSRPSVPPG